MRADDLIRRYIESDPYHPGPADVIIAGYGVPVWALAAYLKSTGGDVSRVATDYDPPSKRSKQLWPTTSVTAMTSTPGSPQTQPERGWPASTSTITSHGWLRTTSSSSVIRR